jgi:hypothetical protein
MDRLTSPYFRFVAIPACSLDSCLRIGFHEIRTLRCVSGWLNSADRNWNSKDFEVTMPSLHSRALISWLVIVILAAPTPAQTLSKARPEELGFSEQRLQSLTDAFQAYVSEGRLAGSVVLVARRGKIAYLKAFGQRDREANAPMPENAIFRVA